MRRSLAPIVLAAGLGFGGTYVALSPDHAAAGFKMVAGSFGGAGCNIKGNVSVSSGERIFHVPGQRYYSETVIRREYGERYFCTEAEARAAGWRRSRV